MKKLSQFCQDGIPRNLSELQNLDILHSNVIEVEDMKKVVLKSTKELF